MSSGMDEEGSALGRRSLLPTAKRFSSIKYGVPQIPVPRTPTCTISRKMEGGSYAQLIDGDARSG
jgi:hypothetical protein